MCPFAEMTDSPCASVLTLEHLPDAMSRCANDYQRCPIYRKLRTHDETRVEKVDPAPQRVAS
jgi:hypothetical protein